MGQGTIPDRSDDSTHLYRNLDAPKYIYTHYLHLWEKSFSNSQQHFQISWLLLYFPIFVGWNSAGSPWVQCFLLLMSRERQVLKFFISSLDLSQESRLLTKCLNKHLKLNILKNQALDLVISTYLSYRVSYLRKWQHHLFRC